MRRLLPALVGLSLLLTACPQDYTPLTVPMDDPNVLSGHWTGGLAQHREVVALLTLGGRVYLKDGNVLEVYDAATGTRLNVLTLPRATAYGRRSVAYRSDGMIVVLGDDKLYLYGAVTLALVSTRDYSQKNTSYDWTLSADGNVMTYKGTQRVSTRSGLPLQTATLDSSLYQQAQSSDDRWWSVSDGKTVYRIVRSEIGTSFDAAPLHPAVTACAPAYFWVEVESLKLANGDERLALTYPDGVLEIRDTDGRLLKTATLATCQTVYLQALPAQPGLLAYASAEGGGVYDLNTGQSIHHFAQDPQRPVPDLPLTAGMLEVTRPTDPATGNFRDPAQQPTYSFHPWDGPTWTLPNVTHSLSLDLTASRSNATSATLTGTALLDGRTLTVSGTLTGFQAELKALATPFSPSLDAHLKFFDGTTQVHSANLQTLLPVKSGNPPAYDPTVPPAYFLDWYEPDAARVVGMLKRP